jgi:hypothetical protein
MTVENFVPLTTLTGLTYLLTFNCYGTHLLGDQRGSVDRTRGDRLGGYCEPSAAPESHAKKLMLDDPYTLDLSRAHFVLAAIREVCTFRGWELFAAHVRSTHVHCVVGHVAVPNRAIADFKAYASRALNRSEDIPALTQNHPALTQNHPALTQNYPHPNAELPPP